MKICAPQGGRGGAEGHCGRALRQSVSNLVAVVSRPATAHS